jgi:hypothetical protein
MALWLRSLNWRSAVGLHGGLKPYQSPTHWATHAVIQNLYCRSRIDNSSVSIDPTHWAEALYASLATQCLPARLTSRYILLEEQSRAGCQGSWGKSLAKLVNVKLINSGLAIAALALNQQWAQVYAVLCQKCMDPVRLEDTAGERHLAYPIRPTGTEILSYSRASVSPP